MKEQQSTFRTEYRESTPWWYRGEFHLAFTLGFTFAVIWYCWRGIDNPSWAELLFVIPTFLFGNWAEWAAHRYILHRPVKGLKMIYKRHSGTHHRFFTHNALHFDDHRDWRALLFPPFAPVMFVLAAVPPALLLGAVWSANAGYLIVLTMTLYYLMYEGLHTLAHIENSPFLDRLPLVNTVRRMHVIHHHPSLMHHRNFNLTFPICDALFGTSDLDRGFWGTLFNGNRHDRMKPGDREAFNRYRNPEEAADAADRAATERGAA